MDLIILISVAVGLIVILGALWFITKSAKSGTSESEGAGRNATILPGARRRQPTFARRVGQGGRGAPAHDEDDDDDGEGPPLDINLPDGKVGAKKMAKLQAKAEKKAQREADQRERDDRKQKQAKEDEERKKLEDKEKEEEKKKEDELRRIQEEKARREHEEYLKMKEAFSVEAEGFEEGVEQPENALHQFVTYIKNNKVVVMEDLAGQFGMKTAAAIQRVDTLLADGILTGVMDDRGKFIFISPEELKAVANFVRQRGRVSIAELVDSSNQLVDLTPKIAA